MVHFSPFWSLTPSYHQQFKYSAQCLALLAYCSWSIQTKSSQNKINSSCNLKASRWSCISRNKKKRTKNTFSTFTHRLAKQIRVEWDDRWQKGCDTGHNGAYIYIFIPANRAGVILNTYLEKMKPSRKQLLWRKWSIDCQGLIVQNTEYIVHLAWLSHFAPFASDVLFAATGLDCEISHILINVTTVITHYFNQFSY